MDEITEISEMPPSAWPWSLNLTPAELVTVYGALRTYLKVLAQQNEEDLEMIARVTQLIGVVKPIAVEASQSVRSS